MVWLGKNAGTGAGGGWDFSLNRVSVGWLGARPVHFLGADHGPERESSGAMEVMRKRCVFDPLGHQLRARHHVTSTSVRRVEGARPRSRVSCVILKLPAAWAIQTAFSRRRQLVGFFALRNTPQSMSVFLILGNVTD